MVLKKGKERKGKERRMEDSHNSNSHPQLVLSHVQPLISHRTKIKEAACWDDEKEEVTKLRPLDLAVRRTLAASGRAVNKRNHGADLVLVGLHPEVLECGLELMAVDRSRATAIKFLEEMSHKVLSLVGVRQKLVPGHLAEVFGRRGAEDVMRAQVDQLEARQLLSYVLYNEHIALRRLHAVEKLAQLLVVSSCAAHEGVIASASVAGVGTVCVLVSELATVVATLELLFLSYRSSHHL